MKKIIANTTPKLNMELARKAADIVMSTELKGVTNEPSTTNITP